MRDMTAYICTSAIVKMLGELGQALLRDNIVAQKDVADVTRATIQQLTECMKLERP